MKLNEIQCVWQGFFNKTRWNVANEPCQAMQLEERVKEVKTM
jgi:hypothetical protein